MRVVVSLTTIPGRAALIGRAIASIQRQTRPPDAIYLWLPEEHFGTSLDGYEFSGVQVALGPDLGPAMKLLPVLSVETDPDTRIIPIDDDVEYPPELIDRLLQASQLHREHAIGFTGWILDPNGTGVGVRHMNEEIPEAAMFQAVHVLEGYRGVLYQRRFFDRDIHEHLEALPAFRRHDDILFSGYLASRGIARTVRWYGSTPTPAKNRWTLHGEDSGLHTTPGWLEQGRTCVDFWMRQTKETAFPPITPADATARLQLCAASQPRPGFTHHDPAESDRDPETRQDLSKRPWPWSDGRFHELLVLDPIAGQIPSPAENQCAPWLDECLRILVPGGHLKLRIPQNWAEGYQDHWNAYLSGRGTGDHGGIRLSIVETEGDLAVVTFFKPPCDGFAGQA